MSLKTWGMIALGTAVGVAGAVPASAQSAQAVEHSGRTFHVAGLRAAAIRTARRAASRMSSRMRAAFRSTEVNPNAATPSGFGPNRF